VHVIQHGIDIVEIRRIERILDQHGERFPQRCFTDDERAYGDAGGRRRAERYAARFATKEATLKALGTGWRSGISWLDIEVVREPSGRPLLRLSGRCAELAEQAGLRHWRLSLSHTDRVAVASVIAYG